MFLRLCWRAPRTEIQRMAETSYCGEYLHGSQGRGGAARKRTFLTTPRHEDTRVKWQKGGEARNDGSSGKYRRLPAGSPRDGGATLLCGDFLGKGAPQGASTDFPRNHPFLFLAPDWRAQGWPTADKAHDEVLLSQAFARPSGHCNQGGNALEDSWEDTEEPRPMAVPLSYPIGLRVAPVPPVPT